MAEFVVRVAARAAQFRPKLRPGLGGAQVTLPCKFQFVGHVRPLMALAGSPVLKRTTLETCQPPIRWLTETGSIGTPAPAPSEWQLPCEEPVHLVAHIEIRVQVLQVGLQALMALPV